MKAIIVTDQAAGTAGMKLVERPEPQAAINDVVVQVHASGFTWDELTWPSTWTDRLGRDRTPVIPGQELAGVVTALGYGTTGLSAGQRVFGLTDSHRGGTLARSSMRTALSRAIACFALAASLFLAEAHGLPALADENGATVTPVASNALPNLPGQRLTAVLVSYAPGGRSPAHHHAGSVIAYVLEGAIRSQLDSGGVRVYRAGESFFEPPGSVHLVSENASATGPARLLAVFVAPEGAALTVDEN